jgi:hypothetical protein
VVITMLPTAEAAALAERLGVPATALFDALRDNPLASPYALDKLSRMVDQDCHADFALDLALKDLDLAASAAGPGVTPVAIAIADRWRGLVSRGSSGLDVSAARQGLGQVDPLRPDAFPSAQPDDELEDRLRTRLRRPGVLSRRGRSGRHARNSVTCRRLARKVRASDRERPPANVKPARRREVSRFRRAVRRRTRAHSGSVAMAVDPTKE